jgi:hypothetical protein
MTADVRQEWWGELRHGGMLLAPALLESTVGDVAPLDERDYERLRLAWLRRTAAAGEPAADREFIAALLESFLDLRDGWQKASTVAPAFKALATNGSALRPDWVLTDPAPPDGAAARHRGAARTADKRPPASPCSRRSRLRRLGRMGRAEVV